MRGYKFFIAKDSPERPKSPKAFYSLRRKLRRSPQSVRGKVVLCANGFHACKNLAQLMLYVPYGVRVVVYEVDVSQDIKHGIDKFVGRTIRFIRRVPAKNVLREWRKSCYDELCASVSNKGWPIVS